MDIGNGYWCSIQQQNEIDYPTRKPLGSRDLLYKRLYSAINCRPDVTFGTVKRLRTLQFDDYCGSITNLNFNPDGSLLFASTEKRAILMFDPFNHKLIRSLHNAHNDSINYIKFLGKYGCYLYFMDGNELIGFLSPFLQTIDYLHPALMIVQ